MDVRVCAVVPCERLASVQGGTQLVPQVTPGFLCDPVENKLFKGWVDGWINELRDMKTFM